MKVLQINSVCGIGSTGRIATDIHNMLIEQGHESYIAYGRELPKYCENAIKIGTKYDNYKHVLLTRVFDKHGFGSKKATIEFINKVIKIDPDVIHLHNIHGYYINIEVLFNYLKEANKPVVWTLHDCWSFTGHCAYFDYVGCEKWKTGCYNCAEKKSYPTSRFVDNSTDNYNKKKDLFSGIKNLTLITPSKWLSELVNKSFLKCYNVEVINNGISTNIFKYRDTDFKRTYDIENKYMILGVASIWDRRKGLNDFLKLSKMLGEEYIIVLVGLNKSQLKMLSDYKNIIGIAKTNNIDELVEIYSAADLFFNPTYEDNYPTTNLESLACGTPVVTYDSGGSPESINEECGYVINPGNIEKVKSLLYSDLLDKNIKVKQNIKDISMVSNEYIHKYISLVKKNSV